MPFLPALRRVVLPAGERKSVTSVAFSRYYQSTGGSEFGGAQTRDWPIERAVAEGYDRVIWVFKSVNTIAADAARLPYRLREGANDADDGDVVDDHPLYRVLNKKANPLETGQVFRKRLSAQILLSKKGAFVEVTKSNGGTVKRLDLLPPDRVDIIPDAEGGVDHFRLRRKNGEVKNLDPSRVRWFRNPHLLDPYMGTTVLEALGMSVELDHLSRQYNVAFMQNDGRPGGVIAVRDTKGGTGEVSPVQQERIEQKFGKGVQAAGQLSVIAGELSYVDLATRPRDMQYAQTSRNSKLEILSGFGIGESVLGFAAERTFDNADNELYVYWTRTQPEHHEIITAGFDEDSEDDLDGFLDTSKIEVLERAAIKKRTEAREEVTAGLRSIYSYAELANLTDEIESTPMTRALLIATGKTPLPSRESDAEALGMAPPPEAPDAGDPAAVDPADPNADPEALPAGDEPLALPAGSSPDPTAGTTADTAGPGAPGTAPTPAAARRGAAAAALAAAAGTKTLPEGGGSPKARTALRLTQSKRASISYDVESAPDEDVADRFEREIALILNSLVERWVERTASRLQRPAGRKGTRHWIPEYENDTRVGTKALDTGRAVDEQTWQQEAETVTSPTIRAAAIAAAAALLADLGVTPPPGYTLARMAADAVGQTVTTVVSNLGRWAATQAQRLAADLDRADRDGDDLTTMIDVARAASDRLGTWANGVATAVAVGTTNAARIDAAREANRDEQIEVISVWYSRRDDRVRPTHRLADGQVRALDEPFVVGDALLRYPQDPLAPLRETAGCRCKVKHRSRKTGRFVMGPERKALRLRDGDGDGLIEDGTSRERPAPLTTLRMTRPNEPAIAAGAAKIARYREEARQHDQPLTGITEWADVRRAIRRPFEMSFTTRSGRQVASGATQVDVMSDDPRVYEISGFMVDTETGEQVADFTRNITVHEDGTVEVYHAGLDVEADAQREGIAGEFNAHAIAYYRSLGVDTIGVSAHGSMKQVVGPPAPVDPHTAAINPNLARALAESGRRIYNGGYTWGQQGFDFEGNAYVYTLLGRLRTALDENPDAEQDVYRALADWDSHTPGEQLDALLLITSLGDPSFSIVDALPEDWWDDARQRGVLLDYLQTVAADEPPTPYEINALGKAHPFRDRDSGEETWLGKALMSRSSWQGVFRLSWLGIYPETKGRLSQVANALPRARSLVAVFLSALAEGDHVETKALVIDGDGDGMVYDGTIRQRPAAPSERLVPATASPVRSARPNEAAVARGARRIGKYRPASRGVPLADVAQIKTWDDDTTREFGQTVWGGSFTTSTGEEFTSEVREVVGRVGGEFRTISGALIGEDGAVIGEWQRTVSFRDDGPAEVNHVDLSVDPSRQGRGIAGEFNAHAIAYYREAQIAAITTIAGGKYKQGEGQYNGGYTWASEGYDWRKPGPNVWGALAGFDKHLMGELVYGLQHDPGMLSEGGGHTVAGALPPGWLTANWAWLVDTLGDIDPANPPTPYELAQVGRDRPFTDVDTGQETWLGKAIMSRGSWDGEFDLSLLDVYPEAKWLAGSARDRLLADAMLASLADEPDDGTKALPRDADGDGFIYDGTIRQRPAPVQARMPRIPRPAMPRGRADGTGTIDDPIDVAGDYDLAARLISTGKHVRLNRTEEIGTLLDRLAVLVREAERDGGAAKIYDLCKVSVPGTNLFCVETMGIERINMPQLSGRPVPGSIADRTLPKNDKGRVNAGDEFRAELRRQGIRVEDKVVPAAWLKASQSQLDGTTVAGMSARIREGTFGDASIYVTRDGYVIDGHHRWAAKVAVDTDDGLLGGIDMQVRMIDMEIGEALAFANAFSQWIGVAAAPVGDPGAQRR